MSSGGADVLVVGAGAYGLSCAWHLARRNAGARVLVLDAGDFASGASGRNGAGFRTQWGLEINVRLCRESVEVFESAADLLDYPRGIGLKQEGCLLVARGEASLERVREGVRVQQGLGVPSELLSPEECRRIAPALTEEGVHGGAFCARDGSLSPFLWLDALHKAVRRAGATVRFRTRVHRLEAQGRGFVASTDIGSLTAGKVILCTDWAVPELLAPAGVELPVEGFPKEGLVTEASRPTIGPMLIDLDGHVAANQTGRGTTVFVCTRERDPGGDARCTPDFLRFASGRILDLLPGIGSLRVLRTWGGVSSTTPDMQPVLGETTVEGLYVAVSAYRGLMTSPAAGRLMADLVLDGPRDEPMLEPLRPGRFAAGDLAPEPLLIA